LSHKKSVRFEEDKQEVDDDEIFASCINTEGLEERKEAETLRVEVVDNVRKDQKTESPLEVNRLEKVRSVGFPQTVI